MVEECEARLEAKLRIASERTQSFETEKQEMIQSFEAKK
jgi:hypothetical protein